MKKLILYFLLVMLTIVTIVGAINGVYWTLLIPIIIWGVVIYKNITTEKTNQFKDWEMKNYNYNATSKKEQKEHYKEYKNEKRKIN